MTESWKADVDRLNQCEREIMEANTEIELEHAQQARRELLAAMTFRHGSEAVIAEAQRRLTIRATFGMLTSEFDKQVQTGEITCSALT